MVRGLRTRTRLLVAFLIAYVALATIGGLTAWQLLDRSLAQQAQERARTIADLAGFMTAPTVRQRIERLTGYDIEWSLDALRERPGTVVSHTENGSILINYRNHKYQEAQQAVVLATLAFVLVGLLLFTAVAWVVARSVAIPVETLALAARRIGTGNLEQPVVVKAGGEIADLAVDLETMRQRLADLDAASRRAERLSTLGAFTAVIAHEIRNPLSAVRMPLQMAADGPIDAETRRVVIDELDRLDLIVDELLAYSGGISVTLAPCELRAEVDAVLALLQRQAQHANVELSVSGHARCLADGKRIRQLVLNLVVNAMQAQHGDGRVTIAIESDGLSVRDYGPGIPDDLQGQLFEAFTSHRSGGTGLGLHIAHAIAVAHQATLTYQSGHPGAVFTLRGLAAGHATQHDDSSPTRPPANNDD